jgi:hypothetical protein
MWYENGKYLKKKKTFEDFIASAEYLIKVGWGGGGWGGVGWGEWGGGGGWGGLGWVGLGWGGGGGWGGIDYMKHLPA